MLLHILDNIYELNSINVIASLKRVVAHDCSILATEYTRHTLQQFSILKIAEGGLVFNH